MTSRDHEVERIYLDMDGVLVNFNSAALEVHNRLGALNTRAPGVYDLPTIAGMPHKEFWDPIQAKPPEWWARLKPTRWAIDLIRLLDRWPITILSKPMGPASMTGKFEWLIHNWPGRVPDHVFPENKAQYVLGRGKRGARPCQVLIDDCDTEIDAWRNMGGRGVIFPTHGNSRYREQLDPLNYVMKELVPSVRA